LAQRYPDQVKSVAGTYIRPELETVAGGARAPLLILLGAVGIVLLIACANVANLLLARTSERQREFAVRASIGAGRGRLVRQLLAESVTFALIGSSFGALAALALIHFVAPLAGDSIPRIDQAGVDGRILAFSVGLAFLTSALFSLAPAMRVARVEIASPLKGGASADGKDRLRNALVIAQIALGLALLSSAGLLAAGFLHLMRRDAGFRTEDLLTFNVSLPDSAQRGSKSLDFYARLLDRLTSLPGVASA